MADKRIIASANPNRHGLIEMFEYTDTAFETSAKYESVFVVAGPSDDDYEDEGDEFNTEAEARVEYDRRVAQYLKEPNWAAQAEYDAQWGTDNGYAYPPREY